jgi:hypothetical protein
MIVAPVLRAAMMAMSPDMAVSPDTVTLICTVVVVMASSGSVTVAGLRPPARPIR